MGLLARMTGVGLSDYICSQGTDRRDAGSVCWLWGEHDGWVFLSELDHGVISCLCTSAADCYSHGHRRSVLLSYAPTAVR